MGGERGECAVDDLDSVSRPAPPNELAVAVVVSLAQRATSSRLLPLLTESERVRRLEGCLLGEEVSVRVASDVSCTKSRLARGVSVPDGGVKGELRSGDRDRVGK